jgi:hypothetical protein
MLCVSLPSLVARILLTFGTPKLQEKHAITLPCAVLPLLQVPAVERLAHVAASTALQPAGGAAEARNFRNFVQGATTHYCMLFRTLCKGRQLTVASFCNCSASRVPRAAGHRLPGSTGFVSGFVGSARMWGQARESSSQAAVLAVYGGACACSQAACRLRAVT